MQADAGARYIKDRYGSPTAAKAFWERNGWYSSGGVVELPKLAWQPILRGAILTEGNYEQVSADPQVRAAYLGGSHAA